MLQLIYTATTIALTTTIRLFTPLTLLSTVCSVCVWKNATATVISYVCTVSVDVGSIHVLLTNRIFLLCKHLHTFFNTKSLLTNVIGRTKHLQIFTFKYQWIQQQNSCTVNNRLSRSLVELGIRVNVFLSEML